MVVVVKKIGLVLTSGNEKLCCVNGWDYVLSMISNITDDILPEKDIVCKRGG